MVELFQNVRHRLVFEHFFGYIIRGVESERQINLMYKSDLETNISAYCESRANITHYSQLFTNIHNAQFPSYYTIISQSWL